MGPIPLLSIFSGGNQVSQWMQAPQAPPNCPPGLEYLTLVDQLLVHQQMEVLEGRLNSWHHCVLRQLLCDWVSLYQRLVKWWSHWACDGWAIELGVTYEMPSH